MVTDLFQLLPDKAVFESVCCYPKGKRKKKEEEEEEMEKKKKEKL